MKTNHSIATLLLLLSLGMTSCSTYYRMTSRIDTNGSMHSTRSTGSSGRREYFKL